MTRFTVFALALTLAGCAEMSSVQRPSLDLGLLGGAETTPPAFRGPGVGIEKPAGGTRVSEEDIHLALEAAGPMTGPVRLAVVEITRGYDAQHRPASLAPEQLDAFRTALGPTVDSVQTIPQMFLPEIADLPSIRYAAARVGANCVFLFSRGSNSGSYLNNWSNLNWFILPIFCIPGKTVEVYTAAEGALVEIATSRVRATAAADIRLDSDITTASSSGRPIEELDREGRVKSIEALGADLGRQMGALKVGQK